LVLRFYPALYRARWGDELEAAMLSCVAREHRRMGAIGVVYAWLRLGIDACSAGTALRLEGLCQRQDINAGPMRHELRSAFARDVCRDLRYGIRALRRAPAFTLVSSVILALGIGGATAVFSVVNAVLITPLPYSEPEALVGIWNTSQAPDSSADVSARQRASTRRSRMPPL
jgi:hypothetical protein